MFCDINLLLVLCLLQVTNNCSDNTTRALCGCLQLMEVVIIRLTLISVSADLNVVSLIMHAACAEPVNYGCLSVISTTDIVALWGIVDKVGMSLMASNKPLMVNNKPLMVSNMSLVVNNKPLMVNNKPLMVNNMSGWMMVLSCSE